MPMLKTTPVQVPGQVPGDASGQARNGRQIDEKHLGIGRGFYPLRIGQARESQVDGNDWT